MTSFTNIIQIQEKLRAIAEEKKKLQALNKRFALCGVGCCGADDTELNKLALLVEDATTNIELINDAEEWLSANRDYQHSLETITNCWVQVLKKRLSIDGSCPESVDAPDGMTDLVPEVDCSIVTAQCAAYYAKIGRAHV